MRVRWRALFFALLLSACPRGTHEHPEAEPAFTYEPYVFGRAGGPKLLWDFGDGSAKQTGDRVEHLYPGVGHFTAAGYDQQFLAERYSLDVLPRPVSRAIPSQARYAVFCPVLSKDFAAVVDFLEQVGSSNFAASLLEESVLPSWAIELSSGAPPFLDSARGIGIFGLDGLEAQIAVMAVADERVAEAALSQRLVERAFAAEEVEGGKYFHNGPVRLFTFSHRGYLYLIAPDADAEPLDDKALAKIANGIRGASPEGLFAAKGFNAARDEVAPGDLWLWSSDSSPNALVTTALLSLDVKPDGATLDGRVSGRKALDQGPSAAIFKGAPIGAVAGLKVSLPAAELVRLLSFRPTPSLPSPKETAAQRGVDLVALSKAFTGDLGVLAWFDAEAFLRNLAAGNGKPDPKGVVHLMLPVTETTPVAAALQKWFGRAGSVAPASGASVWRENESDSVLTAALTDKLLSVRLGDLGSGRADVDVSAQIQRRLPGAFSPGHSSAFVDLIQLRRELEEPRVISGVDPQRVVMAQGFSSAFLNRIAVDFAALDFEPKGAGGTLKGMVTLHPRSK